MAKSIRLLNHLFFVKTLLDPIFQVQSHFKLKNHEIKEGNWFMQELLRLFFFFGEKLENLASSCPELFIILQYKSNSSDVVLYKYSWKTKKIGFEVIKGNMILE